MNRFWSKHIKTISPYIPGEQPRETVTVIKLNTNENPYPPSPKVIAAIKKAVNGRLRLYPDPGCWELKKAIGKHYSLNEDQVFVGNGADEVLAFAFLAFFDQKKPIVFPEVTYSFYAVYAELFHIKYKRLPLCGDGNINPESFFIPNGGVIFANPNAPTGMYVELPQIERILEHNKNSAVVIDETYIDFGGTSAVQLIARFPNLLLIQTFSKGCSLAGLRVGFALGQKDLIEGLRRVKNSVNSYTVDRLALAGAKAAIEDRAYYRRTRAKIIRTREWFIPELRALGFTVMPSLANFVFMRHPAYSAKELLQKLYQQKILVRHFDAPKTKNYLRVSIGRDRDMVLFLRRLQQSMKK